MSVECTNESAIDTNAVLNKGSLECPDLITGVGIASTLPGGKC